MMVAIPSLRNPTVDAIYKHYEDNAEPPRGHLGASQIGHACSRYLWYKFRWSFKELFEGRMLRLFQRGHRAEPWFIKELRAIGVEVWDVDENGKQFHFSDLGGHYAGSCDGFGLGYPEAPKKKHVNEYKTSNDKGFQKLIKSDVEHEKPLHYAQMQQYMEWSGCDRAFYLCENKNDDALYQERIVYDPKFAKQLKAKALRLIEAKEPPTKLSESPTWYECKFCDAYDLCHGTKMPEVNCRTCCHSTPNTNGTDAEWICEKYQAVIPTLDDQLQGCDQHLYIPTLLANVARPIDADAETLKWIEYERPEDGVFRNGIEGYGFSSKEIQQGAVTCD